MSSTTYWHWTIAFDDPSTGERITFEGESIGPANATTDAVLLNLTPDLNTEVQRRYGSGYSIENLSPVCQIEQK
ncbi:MULTISPECIES: hypothetical protein [Streptomyces]|uniref:Uncharacterized protein n=1 Tax=Streptomyces tsukubensis (strain DSM 42081 / NBRC 108919 / NRRL 18488 / 9993) TaxID=1114943 RepID=I2MT32_STRT9|nr:MULTISPECIES: hypothetical protein [Streptomyces]AZK98788.1 hypothetical protein B7R87_33035 [Streptomyces tsukubensis]EIF87929.1 hypothetical protein [Streptomyces tsukubensis NRRL18488]MYS65141.1 hypothetical protein [Streptomyces sp. SID5473]QKM65783.1 hypothetical protein STSU_000070 [Streptomyces tsukubensis NRRL18488]